MRAIVPSKYEQSTIISKVIPEELKGTLLNQAAHELQQGPWGQLLTQHVAREAFSLYKFNVKTAQDISIHFFNLNPVIALFVVEEGELVIESKEFRVSIKRGFAQLVYLPGSTEVKIHFTAFQQNIFFEIGFSAEQFGKIAAALAEINDLSPLSHMVQSNLGLLTSLDAIPLGKTEFELFVNLPAQFLKPGAAAFHLDPRIQDFFRWYILELSPAKDNASIASAGFLVTRQDLFSIRALRTMLETDLAWRPSLQEMASIAGMTSRKLQRVFRHEVKDTISGFRSKMLMQEAVRLLKEKKDPIKAVALSLGFKYLSDFNKLFKKVHGMPPSQWRQTQG